VRVVGVGVVVVAVVCGLLLSSSMMVMVIMTMMMIMMILLESGEEQICNKVFGFAGWMKMCAGEGGGQALMFRIPLPPLLSSCGV
jgi:hypothetical protein